MRDNAITYEGLARLTDELVLLTSEGRRQMAERIRQALSTDANPAENADYFAAREDQAQLERRIALLEDRIASAELVDPDEANGVVDVGELVRLRELASGETLAYELVGSTEADPSAGRISSVSPLGRALLGRKPGDVVVVEAPLGERRFELLAIETPAYARG
jgi:transcription elongation factor GreA